MPTYSASDANQSVVTQAYQTALPLAANQTVMLALFEAGMVESNFQNLNYGDQDSVGYLQQRPSQGWGTVAQIEDVSYATQKFIDAANQVIASNPGMSAGDLAQAVQRSAYPDRYAQAQSAAEQLLQGISGGDLSGLGSGATTGGATGAAGILSGPISALESLLGLDQAKAVYSDMASMLHAGLWLFNPKNWVRVVAAGGAIVLVIAGVVFLGREVK